MPLKSSTSTHGTVTEIVHFLYSLRTLESLTLSGPVAVGLWNRHSDNEHKSTLTSFVRQSQSHNAQQKTP